MAASLAPTEATPRGASRRTLSLCLSTTPDSRSVSRPQTLALSLDHAGLSLCLSTADSRSVSRPRRTLDLSLDYAGLSLCLSTASVVSASRRPSFTCPSTANRFCTEYNRRKLSFLFLGHRRSRACYTDQNLSYEIVLYRWGWQEASFMTSISILRTEKQ